MALNETAIYRFSAHHIYFSSFSAPNFLLTHTRTHSHMRFESSASHSIRTNFASLLQSFRYATLLSLPITLYATRNAITLERSNSQRVYGA